MRCHSVGCGTVGKTLKKSLTARVEFYYTRGMKTPSKMLLALTAAAALSFAHPASANLVTNGGFETGDFTGWTLGGTGVAGVDSNNPHSGSYAASFCCDVTLTQTIPTVAGATYDLTVWFAHFFPANSIQIYWNGNQIENATLITDANYFLSTYAGLVATGSLTEIEFVFGGEGAVYLDDVSVTGVGVPEPFSTLWLALPFAGLIAFRRFRTERV
jgi:hypothetical protein